MTTHDADRASAWRALFITMTNLMNSVESDLKASDGLTLIDIGCLFALDASGRAGVPMGSLAAIFAVDPSVVTYRVGRLEKRGLVAREVHASNRRYVLASITAEGRRRLRTARRHLLSSADEHLFAHVDDEAPATILGLLAPLLEAQGAVRRSVAAPLSAPGSGGPGRGTGRTT